MMNKADFILGTYTDLDDDHLTNIRSVIDEIRHQMLRNERMVLGSYWDAGPTSDPTRRPHSLTVIDMDWIPVPDTPNAISIIVTISAIAFATEDGNRLNELLISNQHDRIELSPALEFIQSEGSLILRDIHAVHWSVREP